MTTIPDGHLKALGRLTVNFQSLEYYLSFLLGSLLGPDLAVGHIVSSQISFPKMCTILSALFRHKVPDQNHRDRLQDILKTASNLEAKRNQLIHSGWATDTQTGSVIRIKISTNRDKGLSYALPDITDDHIDSVANDLSSCARDVLKFMIDLNKSNVVQILMKET